MTALLSTLRARARALRRDALALTLAVRDPRTPWAARALGVLVLGYAFSPIDLIPDVIPVFGLLDDLVLVPLGIAVVVRLVPPAVMADARARAASEAGRPAGRAGAAVVVLIWLALAAWVGAALFPLFPF